MNLPLCQPLLALTRLAQSLYGPVKQRKQITDALGVTIFTSDIVVLVKSIHSEHASIEIMQRAIDAQRKHFGTGCTTLVNLCDVLLKAVSKLVQHGMTSQEVAASLETIEETFLHTVDLMRIPLNEIVFETKPTVYDERLVCVARRLQTQPYDGKLELAMSTALQVYQEQNKKGVKNLLATFSSITDSVVFRLVRGIELASSTQVFSGLLIPQDTEHLAWFRQQCREDAPCMTNIIVIEGDLDIPRGDVEEEFNNLLRSVQVLFIRGDMTDQAIDYLRSNSILVIVVPTHHDLECIVRMCPGLFVIHSVYELLPYAISSSHMQLKVIEIPKCAFDDEEQDETSGFIHIQVVDQTNDDPTFITVLCRAVTRSLSNELHLKILVYLHRLHHTIESNYALPGNGTVWSAISAMLCTSKTNSDLVTQSIADALLELNVSMIQNAQVEQYSINNYLQQMLRVKQVRQHYINQLTNTDATIFFQMYPYHNSPDYGILTDVSQYQRIDNVEATSHAIQQAFRLVQLTLAIDM